MITVDRDSLDTMLAALAHEARTFNNDSHAGNGICCAIAHLIATQPFGSIEQQNLMDSVLTAGFVPEYYAGGIRVGFTANIKE